MSVNHIHIINKYLSVSSVRGLLKFHWQKMGISASFFYQKNSDFLEVFYV
ncbi:Uncharacterized protein dnm_073750 [Desulfonema magnum]|uniref:Uncharacterized protein n=1 Tax=Desulfonema magnum TaxID=45655 RepID=A0A975BTE1_9BACT|nr:Uncharacterized protein dnm_073750 [Desulfonema magnum]